MNVVSGMEALVARRQVGGEPLSQDVARRKVFYISGFDPLGPRRYRELYRREGPKQAQISGYDVRVSALERSEVGNYRWRAHHARRGLDTETEFEFLGWEDIVRRSLKPSLFHVYGLMFRTLWTYISSGALRAMLRLRAGPLIAGLVPALLMIFYLLYAGLIGISAGLLASQVLSVPLIVAVGLGFGATTLAMLATRLFEEQLMIYFMVSDLGYSAGDDGRYPAALSDRLDAFANRIIVAARTGAYDEVLVVGHSSGAQLAVSSLSRALQRHGTEHSAPIALITLGQSIAMSSFLPEAHELRADLARLADEPSVFWLDVTAPGDGACFALTDPAANCRERGRPATALNPLVISAAFRNTMEPSQMRRYRWRLLRMHFQYLCAFAKPDAFDYFEITSGPLALATRFAGRDCSPSMLCAPVAPVRHPA